MPGENDDDAEGLSANLRGAAQNFIQDSREEIEERRRESQARRAQIERRKLDQRALIDRVSAEIGDLEFKDEFSNPDVDVEHTRNTAEHEIVSSYTANGNDVEYVVQTVGQEPPEVTITGWVTEEQLPTVDNLIQQQVVEVVTDRFTGIATPINVDVPYDRAVHNELGRVFEITIELLAIEENL